MMKNLQIILLLFISLPVFSQWNLLNSGTSNYLHDVYCFTDNVVIAVGEGGTIIKTTNGGLTWVGKNTQTTQRLFKVDFATLTVGYAVGENGTIIKTIDGGENWTNIISGTTNTLRTISCLDENTFFVGGDISYLKKSVDGGITFGYVTTPMNSFTMKIKFFTEQLGFSIVNTQIYKTVDGASTWNLLLDSSNFFFLDENIGFVGTYNQGIPKTLDSGLTFNSTNPLYNNEPKYYEAIFSTNQNLFWSLGYDLLVCGCGPQCLFKNELINGVYERIQNCAFNYQMSAMYFTPNGTGYIVGQYGKIFKNTNGENYTLSTKEIDSKAKIIIYPNPAHEIIRISFEEKSIKPIDVKISDLLGKKVFEGNYENTDDVSVNTSLFNSGVYFITIEFDNKKQVQKLIID